MRSAVSEAHLLRQLAETPLCDRLDLVSLSGWSRGAVYPAVAALEREGMVAAIPHASTRTAPTRRYLLTAEGVRRLARAEGISVERLLHSRPVSARWRRLLLERLDGVAATYRLASAVVGAASPIRLRWYRASPMDAAIALPDGRTLAVVRQGRATELTAFAKRLWRLREGPRFGAFLLLVPDPVRLRHLARLMSAARTITFLALERDAAAAGASARIWRTASGSPPLSLTEVLAYTASGAAWPGERPLAHVTPPPALPDPGGGRIPRWLLLSLLTPSEKRALDLLADWPWITRERIAALLGVGRTRLSGVLTRLEGYGLVRATGGDGRLVLSDDGLALLARRDRAAASDARRRWSAEPLDPDAPLTWRNVTGRRSRQLLRTIDHTAAVHGFAAALAGQARDARAGRSSSSTRPTAPRATSATTTACTPSTRTPSASCAARGRGGPSSSSGSAAPSGPRRWPPASLPTCATTPRSGPPTTTGSARTCSSSSRTSSRRTTSWAWPIGR